MATTVSSLYSDYTFTSVDTSGNTTDYLTVQNWRNHTMQIVVTDASTNITVGCEGSLDGTNWFALDPSANDPTVTGTRTVANGTYYFAFTALKLNYIRANYSAETWGGVGEHGKMAVKYSGG